MSRPIQKILIANRGEIACRVITTARRLGIATVAVYSDADRRSLHVRQADESVHIGGSASSESYLNIERIVAAALETGSDAVHPGFGFLSENPLFAAALARAGVLFIGPGTKAIEAMGDKITSKKLAEQAGVSTVPGFPDAVPTAEEAVTIAERIGCPVMLKASAGGGGKGMRVAHRMEDVADSFISAQNEARTAFGDDRVFVEKFIEQPRHIEIQVIADTHGNCLYLGERECSIQRRHQKVIEEAPSSFITEETRRAMGEQAVALAKAVDYVSAGTVEFIVDADQQFFFLEMNTRLQVEHPVTELITGLDLVELMIRVAEGKTLPLQQKDVRLDGWAFEARVYAEDVDRGFLPSTGRVTHYELPDNLEGVRVDTGIAAGGEISMFYDPMIAKLVTWGNSRSQAIERMQSALDSYLIRGVQHNIAFLSALFDHPALQAGDLTTAFIDDHFSDGFNSREYATGHLDLLPILAAWLENTRIAGSWVSDSMGGSYPATDMAVFTGDVRTDVQAESSTTVTSSWTLSDAVFNGVVSGVPMRAVVDRLADGWRLTHRGSCRDFLTCPLHVAELKALMPKPTVLDRSNQLLSPMPGLLMKVLVSEGDSVIAGQDLAVIEAMKMENTLTAERNGVVARIHADTGSSLAVDDVILEFATPDAAGSE